MLNLSCLGGGGPFSSSKKRRSHGSARFFYRLCVLKDGTPHLVTSNEQFEFLIEANGFPVHCGLPCGATLCTLCSRPTLKQ